MTSSSRFTGKIALVTGATRGLGTAVAHDLAREGEHLIALGRTIGALEELDDDIKDAGGIATLIGMDLRKGQDIDALGPTLYQRWGHLDVAILNAGILGPVTPVGHIGDTEWNEVIEVNLTANMRLLRTLDPLLRRAEAARVLVVSSGATQRPRAYWSPYLASKAGLEALVHCYADEVASTAMKVNIAYPGKTRTAMRAKAYPGEDPMTLPTPEEIASRLVDLVAPDISANGKVFDVSPVRQ